MELPEDLVRDFSAAWRDEFQETLTREEATREIQRLGEILRVLSRPLPGEERRKEPP